MENFELGESHSGEHLGPAKSIKNFCAAAQD
jgi:hypothetical protein